MIPVPIKTLYIYILNSGKPPANSNDGCWQYYWDAVFYIMNNNLSDDNNKESESVEDWMMNYLINNVKLQQK